MSSSREIHLLERLANLLRAESRGVAHGAGLQPVQVEVLAYLERCNRYSDTPSAVTEFLGLTKGTVSQSILRLEEKGLIERTIDEADARMSHLKLTRSGRRELSSWQETIEAVFEEAIATTSDLGDQLEGLLRTVQERGGHQSFGVCRTCRFFERKGTGRFQCGLTRERLSKRDSGLICREHAFSKPPAADESVTVPR